LHQHHAAATKKVCHDAGSPSFPMPESTASSVHHQQPETQFGGGTMVAGGGMSSLPSQLPTFSLDSECAETGASMQFSMTALRMQIDDDDNQKEQSPLALAMGSSGTFRIPTAQVFPGKGELAAVHAQLRQELTQLKARGLEGSYRYVQQEMALGVLERNELEYVVEKRSTAARSGDKGQQGNGGGGRGGRGGGDGLSTHRKMPDGAADTQLGHALDALQRAILAPAGLPAKTRFLGVGADTMAALSLVAQDHAAAVEEEGAW
jgi:hypothetical protein